MPRPYRVTTSVTSVGTFYTTPWQPNHMAHPFAIGVGVVTSSSLSQLFSVQHTFDPIFDDAIPGQVTIASTSAVWHNHASLTSISCDCDGNYAFAVIGIRLACTTSSSGVSATMTLVQAGP